MTEHGSQDDGDERALEALAALREGRDIPTPDRSAAALVDRARAALGLVGGRRPELVVATGVAVCLLAAGLVLGAWWLLGSGGSSAASGDALFAPGPSSAAAPSTAPGSGDAGSGAPSSAATATSEPSTGIVVHAAGAVVRPGLHQLPAGARVDDLLGAAGGPAPDADLDRLNLAAPLADGQRLYVPRVGEVAPSVVAPDGAGPTSGPGSGPTAPIDLNTATVEQLDALPGVGPATATAIVDHRERSGPFRVVDDLLDVKGIGPAKLEALRDLVTAG